MTLSPLTRLQFLTVAFAAMLSFGAFAVPAHAALSDADGDGTLSVTPTTAVAGATNLAFLFDFEQDHNYPLLQRLTRSFYLPGSEFVLTIPGGWTEPQLADEEAPGYLNIEEGTGGGPLHVNSCNFTPLDVSVTESETGPWLVVIPQHCGYHDHLTITYSGVTAPEAGMYEFTAWTRAGFTGGSNIDESPVVVVSPVCEEGYHAEGISCEPNDPPFCPEGYYLEGGSCTPEAEGDPSICPENALYNEETHLCVFEPAPYSCEEGLTLNNETGMCEVPPTDYSCPDGFTPNGMGCTNGDDTAVPICPEGTEFTGGEEGEGMCTAPSYAPTCPEGTSFNSELAVCTAEDVAPSCPAHYELMSVDEGPLMCVYQPFPPSCSEGFHLSEDATACFADPEPLTCDDGFHVEGDMCVEDSTSSSTVIVWPGNMHGWDLLNYDATLDTDSSATTTSGTGGFFIFGFSIPPLGAGSFEQVVGENGDEATRLRSSDYNGTLLADITSLSYDTFTVANGGAQDTYLQLRIDRDANGEWDDALFFEPVYQTGTYGMLGYSPDPVPNQCGENPNCVSLGEWQSWDAYLGGWWSNNDSAGGPPLTTLAAYAAEYPDAVLATDVPAIRIQAGAGAPVWNNYNGAFDKFVIGVHSGTNTQTTTYDFEPVVDEPASESGGGGGTTHHPQERRKSTGDVLGAATGPAAACSVLTSYLWPNNTANDPVQVKALQEFLAKELGIELTATGVFDESTKLAVMVFQLKYWEDVLAPWVPFGLPTDHTATGNVFKLTLWKINAISCAPEVIPTPTLP